MRVKRENFSQRGGRENPKYDRKDRRVEIKINPDIFLYLKEGEGEFNIDTYVFYQEEEVDRERERERDIYKLHSSNNGTYLGW